MGPSAVERHPTRTLASYRTFLAGLEQEVRDAPPKDARVQTALLLLRLCGQGKVTHLNISTRLAACTSNGRLWLSCNGLTVARPSWILPMITSAPANSTHCMAK